jgi:hypothetical protein
MAPRTRTTRGEASPFAAADAPSALELQGERAVHYVLVSGRQDDGVWGLVGAVWLSADGLRGGFLVHPWAIDLGAEMVRSYRGALARGFTPSTIFDYWAKEPWTGSSVIVEDERHAETLLLVNELLNVL